MISKEKLLKRYKRLCEKIEQLNEQHYQLEQELITYLSED